MATHVDIDDLVLNYDPEAPQERFRAAGLKAALAPLAARLPGSVPWPQAGKPVAAPLDSPPAESEDLSKFHGYDAVVVTWTAAEAAALATLFTPDYLPSQWYEYRHDVASYVPLVTGHKAPFNAKQADMARTTTALACIFRAASAAKVPLFKSGLHLDYDGPGVPVRKLMTELVTTIGPKVHHHRHRRRHRAGRGARRCRHRRAHEVPRTTQFKAQQWASARTKPPPPSGV
jgi:hypothetical protein